MTPEDTPFGSAALREGRYWFLAELGRGSTSEVYLVAAESAVGLEKLHVLKRLKRDLADEPEFLAMFLDEGRLAARLEHPNVIRTIEVGMGKSRPHIVMEYLEGRSVYELVHAARAGRLMLQRHHWIAIVANVLSALAYAHKLDDFDGTPLRIVHRDVSPGNVLVSYAGEVKLTDFGIAKAALRSGQTGVGTIKGKARYMAPEQIAGGAVDGRADLFAAGAMLFELIAGRSPWKEPIRIGKRGRAPLLSSVASDIPPELDAICERALRDDPNERYQSAGEMLEELESFVERSGRRVNYHELGRVLQEGLGEERARRAEIVRDQLAKMREAQRQGGQSLVSVPDTRESTPPEPTSVSLRPERRPRRTGRTWVAAAAVAATAAAVGAGIVVVAQRGGDRHPYPPRLATNTAPAEPASGNAEERDEPKEIELFIVALPANATISVDGVPVSDNPYTARVAADGQVHHVRVEAPGHVSVERELRYDDDVVLRIKLTGATPSPPAASVDDLPRVRQGL